MSNKNKVIAIIVAVLVIGLSFSAGYIFGLNDPYSQGVGPSIIDQAWSEILKEYVDRDEIDTQILSHGAIEGMLEALDDPYSSFLNPDEYALFASGFEGEFEGIGAQVAAEDGKLTIIAPIAGSPAEKAGIKAGDVILEIDGEPVADMSFGEAVLKIRGTK